MYAISKKLVLSFLLTSTLILVYAQSKKDIRQYNYGKELFKKKYYAQSYVIFKKLADTQPANSMTPYALYLSALSSYHNGNIHSAMQLLYHLIANYADWDQRNEAFYTLALAAYQNKEFADSYGYMEELNKDLLKEKNTLKQVLVKYLNLRQLKNLYSTDQTDPIVSRTLFGILESDQNARNSNPNLYMRLKKQYAPEAEFKDIYKKKYNIAVLLPFFTDEIDPSKPASYQVVLDLYQGIKMARDTLVKQGIALQIFAFDTEKTPEKTKIILSDPAMTKMDMIIGPLYMNTISETNAFAANYQKPIINPLSRNVKILASNKNTYLLFPSYRTQGKVAADFAIDSLQSNTAKIIYGLAATDKITALSFKERFEQRGKHVALFHEFDNGKTAFNELLTNLGSPQKDTLTSVFISTSNAVTASNAFSILKNLQNPSPVIAMGEWLNFRQITYEQLEEESIYLIYPDYVNRNSEAFKTFTKAYIRRQKTIPSIYSMSGYETMYYFGKMLAKYGIGFQKLIKNENYHRGLLFSGFNYQNSRDNQVVPIVKFINGDLKTVNQSQFRLSD